MGSEEPDTETNPSDNTWVAFRKDIQDQYSPGHVIGGVDQIIDDIDRIDNELYVKNGLEALSERGVLDEQQDGYRVAPDE